MLIVKTNPTGVDNAIQKLQTMLHGKLMKAWGMDPSDTTQNALYESYGRCYRNKDEKNGYIAEVFTGSNEYQEVYWKDSLNAISFFSVADRVDQNLGEGKTNVALIFFVNLSKLKPSIVHRADEEVRQDVLTAIGAHAYGFSTSSCETGIDNVLKEFPGSRRDERLKAVDMHPIHTFRINLSLLFRHNNC